MSVNWEELRQKLPAEKTPDQKAQRMKLFDSMDGNGTGKLSLAEIDKGVRDVLQLDEVFDAKPVIMRAYQAARAVGNKRGRCEDDDYVERAEFRLLLVYLRQFFELNIMFSSVDTTDDRRISLDEFRAAVPKLSEWGVEVSDPEAAFREIDTNDGGMVLFVEFVDWAMKKQLDLEEDDD
eukprot:NODE_2522_length_682_cov_69.417062_g2064_i0.p1 GENE.NODE_2522_length_682_cov_69.417062_g2064_i0~~NODE_2522_length_682_cov_69.417062_g2064_i0.p1  ORF type:complete len:198 (+),score=82.26 NODE_2522_length_682_cov_69.417062_g2064_i0:58-594(+)